MYEFEVLLEDGTIVYFWGDCEEDVWAEYGDEAMAVNCIGMKED